MFWNRFCALFRLLFEQGFQILFDVGVANTLQFLRRNHRQQIPTQLERLLDGAVLVLALSLDRKSVV